ncbi:flagellar motor protein MotB [Halobacteriovorax sp. GB3]|uniref:OmpA/MotB family protein n=1 Tax=Halobacteriovorax sp. GB3 TaxID=2719615 RepID=UPI002362A993|nr:flagellar motor protein MotB [Halobacteriovorax sp. GB3]MDD0853861.1 flagellar motor protein MotB [Halobacteriovorax sp. GB3]
MAEEGVNAQPIEEGGGSNDDVKCPECPPGLPGWMATFSDLVTLLLTFFVLLLSMAKTETSKYEAALGSIRNAFGGNVLKQGEVIQPGKSPDDFPTMMESNEVIKPFPIEFLTMEGILDKHEINRESDEQLSQMKLDLKEYELSESVDVFEQPEGIKVRIKDQIFFKSGSIEIEPTRVSTEVYEKVVKLLKGKTWTVFVLGHASRGETSRDGRSDAWALSAARAQAVTKSLIRRGVTPSRITTTFYGDTRPVVRPNRSQEENEYDSRRVEFIIRKTDLQTDGHKVQSQ